LFDDGERISPALPCIEGGCAEFLPAAPPWRDQEYINHCSKCVRSKNVIEYLTGADSDRQKSCRQGSLKNHDGIERGAQFMAHLSRNLAFRAIGPFCRIFGVLQIVLDSICGA